MAIFTRKNGMYQEVSERLSIKARRVEGCMDHEDVQRMKEIAGMITSDVDQTLFSIKQLGISAEQDPLVKPIYEKFNPGEIRLGGTAAIVALTNRWATMDNDGQRKAEMLAVMAAESFALKYSLDNNLIIKGQVPPFMFTIWGTKF